MASTSLQSAKLIVPGSRDEAVAEFGDGSGLTVLAGGTILMPEINYGRLRPDRVLLLQHAGLSGVSRNGSGLTIGAMTPVAELEDAPEPLATTARHVADPEIRARPLSEGTSARRPAGRPPRGSAGGTDCARGQGPLRRERRRAHRAGRGFPRRRSRGTGCCSRSSSRSRRGQRYGRRTTTSCACLHGSRRLSRPSLQGSSRRPSPGPVRHGSLHRPSSKRSQADASARGSSTEVLDDVEPAGRRARVRLVPEPHRSRSLS